MWCTCVFTHIWVWVCACTLINMGIKWKIWSCLPQWLFTLYIKAEYLAEYRNLQFRLVLLAILAQILSLPPGCTHLAFMWILRPNAGSQVWQALYWRLSSWPKILSLWPGVSHPRAAAPRHWPSSPSSQASCSDLQSLPLLFYSFHVPRLSVAAERSKLLELVTS